MRHRRRLASAGCRRMATLATRSSPPFPAWSRRSTPARHRVADRPSSGDGTRGRSRTPSRGRGGRACRATTIPSRSATERDAWRSSPPRPGGGAGTSRPRTCRRQTAFRPTPGQVSCRHEPVTSRRAPTSGHSRQTATVGARRGRVSHVPRTGVGRDARGTAGLRACAEPQDRDLSRARVVTAATRRTQLAAAAATCCASTLVARPAGDTRMKVRGET